MKIFTIVGARPQFIKAALVSREIRKRHTEILLHTGQHYDYDMSDVFFKTLRVPKPDYSLSVGSGLHGEQTGKMLVGIEKALKREEPDVVLVYGDTNSTLAGALAASKLHIPIAHVEAGLRSFNRKMPEEINRVIADHLSKLLFCPTKTAVGNLRDEGITEGVKLVGDVMYDLFIAMRPQVEKSNILNRLSLEPRGYNLLTLHRQENADTAANLRAVLSAVAESGVATVFPVHPRTAGSLKRFGMNECARRIPNLKMTEPLGYLDFQKLLIHAGKVLTDSGGVQKEAYFAKVPCITLRGETEWVETVYDGWNILVGCGKERILRAIKRFKPRKRQRKLFGDGRSAGRMASLLSTV